MSTPGAPDGFGQQISGRTSVQRAAAAMFLAGAATNTVGIWTTTQPTWSRLVQAGLSAVFLAAGIWLVVAHHAPRRWIEVAAFGAIPVVGVLVVVGRPLSAAPFFLLWPVVLIAYFYPRKHLVGVAAFALVTLVASLAAHPPSPIKIDLFMATSITVGLIAWLVSTMTERQRVLREQLARAAETDPLTSVLNRRAFHPRLGHLVAEAVDRSAPLCVVALDLDHFKAINDAYGHLAGDEALVHVAGVLTDVSRASDLVGRFGGEEFVVALPGSTANEARRFAARVADGIRRVPGLDAPVSASVGICELSPVSDSADLLLRHADQALYVAKGAGRGRPAVWGERVVVDGPFVQAAARPAVDQRAAS